MQRQRIQFTVVHALSAVLGKLPSELSEWTEAMLLEADETRGIGEFLSWISGVLTTTFRMLVGYAFHAGWANRPLLATCSALYFGGLASFVFVRLMLELATANIPLLWGSMWMSAARCVALAVVCLAAAIGIWCRRNYARYLAIGVAAAQLLATLVTISPQEDAPLTFVKLCTDLAIIVMMTHRSVRTAFRTLPPSNPHFDV